MRTRLLFGVLMLALAAATVFAVWPAVGGAPWLDDAASPQRGVAAYSAEEAVGRVRAALEIEVECKDVGFHVRWTAVPQADQRCWRVAAVCRQETGPALLPISVWGGLVTLTEESTQWLVCDEAGAVVPLTDFAAKFMRPSGN